MFEEWKRDWKSFKKAPAGERFERRYRERKQERRREGKLWQRVLTIAVGLALIGAGVIMLVIPGPGLLAIAFGGALFAQEFRWAAVALDWAEVALRKAFRVAGRFWKSASLAVRGFVVVMGAAVAAGAAYLAWTWLIR